MVLTDASMLVSKLRERGLKIALAESCTGGLLAKLLTDVPGASCVFDCGIVSYSNDIKHSVLGVETATLERFGAVSEQTVIEMARGVLNLSGADIGVAVSGIAGPGNEGTSKPAGLIYICVIYKDTVRTIRLENHFKENIRENNRLSAADEAFSAVSDILD